MHRQRISFAYDNIGNREFAQKAAEEVTQYESNALNQYTAVGDFIPEFDLAGNQTLVKTSTGIWHVTYNAEKRPVNFTCIGSDTMIECAYDYMGRRATKKVTINGEVTLHQRYIYRGYLQITCCDLTRAVSPALWHILWDPTQPTATRPLAIQKDGVWYTYGWDLTKNICEIYGQTGYIRTLYTYTPYGSVTEEGDVIQPIQWSSEFYDTELGLVYYNYRYYNPKCGQWIRRDPIGEKDSYNLYRFLSSNPLEEYDVLGRESGEKPCCTVTLYVDPPASEAVENNILNVYVDTGHTWVEFEYCGETITFSVGPKDGIDPNSKKSLKRFKKGKTPGTTNFPTASHRKNAVTKEWRLNKAQCEKAKEVFDEQTQQEINYTLEYQCTSSALILLNYIPISPPPPDWVGPVVVKVPDNEGNEEIYWQGNMPNPYHLSKALEAG